MGLKVQGLPLWAIRLSGYLNLGTNREFWGLIAQNPFRFRLKVWEFRA